MTSSSTTVARWDDRAFLRRPDVIGRNYSPQAVTLYFHHLLARHPQGRGLPADDEPPPQSTDVSASHASAPQDDSADRLRAARIGAEVERYWRTVQEVAPLSALPEHRTVWEDGILRRLTSGPSYHRHRAGGDTVPQALIDKYGLAAFLPPAPRLSPAQVVEGMFLDVARSYATALRRAMLDYDLLGPDPVAQHHGLSVELIRAAREPTRAPLSREACGISGAAVALAGASLARRLNTTEPVIGQLMALWFAPSRVAAVSGGGPASAYAAVPVAAFRESALYAALPLQLDDLSSAVDAQVRRAAGGYVWQLRGHPASRPTPPPAD